METVRTTTTEIWHKNYNLKKKDNLDSLPREKAIFGIFANVGDVPSNCRYVGETENLQATIKELYDNNGHARLKKFMQGPWFIFLQFELLPGSSSEERTKVVTEWTDQHKPGLDEDGEYPGYYEY